MLHRPGEQELVQLPPLELLGQSPPQIAGDLPQVIGASLLPGAVVDQLTDRDPQPLRQASHRDRWRRDDIVGHEPQPRQAAQLNRGTQTVRSAVAGDHERLIRRRQREVPDQLLPADVREPSKLVQLLVREHITRRHPAPCSAALIEVTARYAGSKQPPKPGSTTPGTATNR